MFNVDDIVMYTTNGICKITGIEELNFIGKPVKYYVLVPLSETKTKITVPVENELTKKRLHHLLSEDEINDIIHEIPFMEPYWIERDNDRKIQFGELIKSGDRKETLKVIKSIKKHIVDVKEKGRKLHATDESAMKDALKLILDEFSFVLKRDRAELFIELDSLLAPKIEEN